MLALGAQISIATSQAFDHLQLVKLSCQSHWSHATLALGVEICIAISQV